MNKENRKAYLPIVLLFIILNGLILIFKRFLEDHGFVREFLIWANLFLFLISIGGFLLQRKGLQSPNPQAFVRGVYASMMFKMFVTMIVVLIYVFLVRSKINKPGLFTAMGLYIVYTVVEVTALTKVARKKKNA
jgi:FtsH-binding integral membrane protein